MKKITLILFALFTCWQINAQVSSYAFSQSNGTYSEIIGGTVLGVATNDDASFNAQPIGFSFVYNGVTFTQFSVNANGFLALGATVASSYTALTDGTSNNVVAALNGDLQGNATTGELSYQLSGTAPNQVLTVQWKSYRHYNATGNNYNFQVKLHETTNLIEVVYGTFVQNATARTRQVGLRGASNADFNNRTTTTDWSATTAGGTNAANCTLTTAVVPTSGLTFTWTPPSCASPAGFVASAITTNSATIAWNAAVPVPSTGYEYYYSDVNTAPSGAGTATTNLTENLTGLSVNTTYYVWLRSDCGGTFSAWNGPFTFTTACVSVTDFVQDFEATTGAIFPNCWSKVGTTGTAYTQASTGITGARNLYMYSGSSTSRPVVAIQAVSNANAGTHRMRMKVRGNFTAGETIELGYLTNPADATSFTAINSIVTNTTVAANAQDFVTVPTGTGMPTGDVVFALRTGTALLSVLIDNVIWEPIPSCVEPNTIIASNITSGSVDLSWTNGSGGLQFDYEYAIQAPATGIPAGAGAPIDDVTIVDEGFDINGSPLTANTLYEVYVRSDCGGGDFSPWVGPITFRTLCVADNVPYNQNFESATVPNLPSCTTQQNVGSGNLWTVQNYPDYGFTTKALRYAWNGSNAANVWFYTNGINLVGGTTYRITYDYGGTGTFFPEKLKVAYGTSANAAAMTNLLADHPNVVNDTPVNNFVDFTPSTSGVYYFGFNAYSIADQFYLFVDNVVVDVALSNGSFNNSNFTAYPNPVKDIFNVSYSSEISAVRVLNLLGQEVISQEVNTTSTQIDMSQLSTGTYIVNVTVGDTIKVIKVVKQ
jgi:hypothetical protein